MTPTRRLGWTALALLALAGCDAGTTAPAPAPAPASKPEDVKALPTEPAKTGAAEKLNDEEIAELKKLPPEDQKVALAQVVCPVGGGHLGDMGAPVKEVVDGQTVFLCCGSCEKEFKADPAKFLAKLKK